MTPERKVKAIVKQLCRAKGGLFRFIQYVGKRGCPDCVCILPGGRPLFIETKSEKGRLSPEQKLEIAAYAEREVRIHVIKSAEEAAELLT
jgi:hypothetical protein